METKNSTEIEVKANEIKLVSLKDIKLNPKNRNKHGHDQIEQLKKIIKYQGFRRPCTISNQTGLLVCGEGRYLAAVGLGMKQIPVMYQDYSSIEQEYADGIADNAIDKQAILDFTAINADIGDLGPDFDIDLLGIKDFKIDVNDVERESLSDRFGVPPFSVLDTRQEYWTKRKDQWDLMGIESLKGRDSDLLKIDISKNFKTLGNGFEGTSIFDPVLCEIIYKWFSPKGSTVLDPFAGGSVRGIVASLVNRNYIGIDLREEQITENIKQANDIKLTNMPRWIVGDSIKIDELVSDPVDLVFSCPPYFDLETYSKDPKDLSNMTWPQFIELYKSIIKKSCSLLKVNSFACFVVSEIRDKKGMNRGLVPLTIEAFKEAGLDFYNEATLINHFGSAIIRANRMFTTARKLVRCHQNVLVFIKGDPKLATDKIGNQDLGNEELAQVNSSNISL